MSLSILTTVTIGSIFSAEFLGRIDGIDVTDTTPEQDGFIDALELLLAGVAKSLNCEDEDEVLRTAYLIHDMDTTSNWFLAGSA